ncbi:methyl-accepting chemotaxis protein [Silanimonas sp.]|jgi:methyl-accepting chemotaxis protein|uniref:methyl-accepting chemotaxis protein n=1 Tax=Silanimonas sp. TaxID=1929290 RepID=UPI0037CC8159
MAASRSSLGSIRNRLLFGGSALALVPLVAVVLLLAYFAIDASRDALTQRAYEQMQSIRVGKQEEIQTYFDQVGDAMALVARTADVRGALTAMPAALDALPAESGVDPVAANAALLAYYSNEFGTEFGNRNGGESVDITDNIARLSPAAATAQYLYIASNPNPLGKKGELDRAADASSFSALHAGIHGIGRAAVQRYGLYDFFLVDMDGDLVYTYFKELDFATNLADGPWAETGLGRAFAASRTGRAAGEVQITDYAPYLPSYNDQASFMSTPVFDGDRQIGVFVVQLPIDRVNAIMTFDGGWQDVGLGESGEVYLVGEDRTPRSISRFMAEDPVGFIAAVAAVDTDPARLASMRNRGTNIGAMTIATRGVDEAIAGRSGVAIYPDYRGVPVLGSYAPIDVLGLRWAILAEIDQAESDRPVQALIERIGLVALVAFVLFTLAGILVALRLARSINQPLAHLGDVVRRFGAGDDAVRAKLAPKDEIGELGVAFDRMLDDRVATQQRIEKENDDLNNSVVEIMTSVAELANRDLTVKVPVSENVTGAVSDAINMMTRSTAGALQRVQGISDAVSERSRGVLRRADQVRDVANAAAEQATSASEELQQAAMALRGMGEQAGQASVRAEQAIHSATGALEIVRATAGGIASSRDQIRETEKRVKRLGERSQEIGSVVSIIGQIAERTSVLALNASMQAVAAGDAGRGFAVVADEVKRLAENARHATQQIASLVGAIQADTAETISAMNVTITQVVDMSKLADRAGSQMADTRQATEQLVASVRDIAQSAQAQGLASQTLLNRAYQLLQASQKTLDEIDAQRGDAEALDRSAGELVGTVGEFRLPGH